MRMFSDFKHNIITVQTHYFTSYNIFYVTLKCVIISTH
jgi:hypothetical protein